MAVLEHKSVSVFEYTTVGTTTSKSSLFNNVQAKPVPIGQQVMVPSKAI